MQPDEAHEPDDDELNEPARVIEREWEDVDWQDFAACRGEGPALFFPPAGERPEVRHAREAFARDAFCEGCTVARDCRDFGRRHREYGTWFETEEERVAAGFTPDMPIGVSARLARLIRQGLIAR